MWVTPGRPSPSGDLDGTQWLRRYQGAAVRVVGRKTWVDSTEMGQKDMGQVAILRTREVEFDF